MDKFFQPYKENIVDFPYVSRTTLWSLLRTMGFKYKKRAGRRCVHERTGIVAKRHEFLREVKKVREQGRPIIYLDERWVNQHHSRARA